MAGDFLVVVAVAAVVVDGRNDLSVLYAKRGIFLDKTIKLKNYE